MNKISCHLVKDLLPLVIDGVVSEETKQEVEEHLNDCAECRKEYEQLKREVPIPVGEELQEESVQVLKHMKRSMAKKNILDSLVAAVITLALIVAGYFVVTEVDVVNRYVEPHLYATIRDNDTKGWQPLTFYEEITGEETSDVLVFDSVFFRREIVNDANSDAAVTLRVTNSRGTVVLDDLVIQPGTSASLKQLERNQEYQVELKTEGDTIFLNLF